MRFIRTTHDDQEQFRAFPDDANTFWRTTGGLVGHMLSPYLPLSLDDVHRECREYQLTYQDGVLREANIQYVAFVLIRLCEYGMAKAVD
jgi:hypothetical protein